MKNLNKKFISTSIAFLVLSLSGCLNEVEPKTEISNPIILVSQNIWGHIEKSLVECQPEEGSAEGYQYKQCE